MVAAAATTPTRTPSSNREGGAGRLGVVGAAGVVCGVVLVAVLPVIAGKEIEAAGSLKGITSATHTQSSVRLHGRVKPWPSCWRAS